MLLLAGFWVSLVHSQAVKIDIIEKTMSVSHRTLLIPLQRLKIQYSKDTFCCVNSLVTVFFHLITLIDALMH